jgi:hypothetical protein
MLSMNASNVEWLLHAVCSPGSCLLFDVPLLIGAALAIAFWWFARDGSDAG